MIYSSLEELASAIGSIHQEFDDMRAELKSMVESLDGQWIGTAYEEFQSVFERVDNKLYLVSTSVQNYVSAIQGAAESEKETEAGSANAIRSRQRNYSYQPTAKGRGR